MSNAESARLIFGADAGDKSAATAAVGRQQHRRHRRRKRPPETGGDSKRDGVGRKGEIVGTPYDGGEGVGEPVAATKWKRGDDDSISNSSPSPDAAADAAAAAARAPAANTAVATNSSLKLSFDKEAVTLLPDAGLEVESAKVSGKQNKKIITNK